MDISLESEFEKLTLPNGGSRFKGEDFRQMCGPIVYMFLKDNDVLYVGMSSCGLARPGSRQHHMADSARQDCDEVLIWPTKSAAAAIELESLLIAVFRPLQNKRIQSSLVPIIPLRSAIKSRIPPKNVVRWHSEASTIKHR
jgi:hypothetical protein